MNRSEYQNIKITSNREQLASAGFIHPFPQTVNWMHVYPKAQILDVSTMYADGIIPVMKIYYIFGKCHYVQLGFLHHNIIISMKH